MLYNLSSWLRKAGRKVVTLSKATSCLQKTCLIIFTSFIAICLLLLDRAYKLEIATQLLS